MPAALRKARRVTSGSSNRILSEGTWYLIRGYCREPCNDLLGVSRRHALRFSTIEQLFLQLISYQRQYEHLETMLLGPCISPTCA